MATIKEQRAKLQEKIATLQAREKALAAKDKEQERKARTKRLIELGAIVESKLTPEAIEALKIMKPEGFAKMSEWLTQQKKENPQSQNDVDEKEKNPPICERCGIPMVQKQSKSGKWYWACPNAKYGDEHEFGGWVNDSQN